MLAYRASPCGALEGGLSKYGILARFVYIFHIWLLKSSILAQIWKYDAATNDVPLQFGLREQMQDAARPSSLTGTDAEVESMRTIEGKAAPAVRTSATEKTVGCRHSVCGNCARQDMGGSPERFAGAYQHLRLELRGSIFPRWSCG
jgi:hypothetical protein